MEKEIRKKIRGINLWAKVGLVMTFTVLMSPFMKPAESFAAPTANGRITYGIGTTTPQSRNYTASTNVFDAAAAATSNQIPTHVVEKACPTRAEHIAGYVNITNNTLYIMRWNGTAWSDEWNVSVAGNSVDGRRFDIAYEATSGRAMVVYSKNVNGSVGAEMAYRLYDGATWTTAADLPNSARLNQVASVTAIKLASRPGTNEIAVAAEDSGTTTANSSLITSFIWDGLAWGNELGTAITANMANTVAQLVQNDAFDLAYESVTGDLLLVASASAQQYYVTYSGTGTKAWGAWASLGTGRSTPLQMVLASDPGSDQIVMAFSRSGSTSLYTQIWSGSAFTVNGTNQTVVAPAVELKQLAVAWLRSGTTSIAVVLFNAANANINYAYYLGTTWTNNQTWTPLGTLASGGKRWMAVDVDPASKDTLMFTFSDVNTTGNLWAKRLQFTAPATLVWTNADGGIALTTALTTTLTTPRFSFAYDRYAVTAPIVTSPTVTQIADTTATLGATITSDGNSAITERGIVWSTTSGDRATNIIKDGTNTGTGVYTQAITGLTAGARIYFSGYAINGTGTGYSPEGSFYPEPTTQASNVNFTNIASGGMTVNWTAGTGDGVLVVMRATATTAVDPTDGAVYTANGVFGQGGTTGAGNYVVYSGPNTATSVAVTNLAGGANYTVTAYAYSGSGATAVPSYGINYLTAAAPSNNQSTSNFVLNVGQGTGSATATVYQGDARKTLASFTLATNLETETVSSITMTGTAGLTATNVAKAQLWADTNSNGIVDAGDIQVGSDVTTFTGTTAVFSGLNLTVGATPIQYLVSLDLTAIPTNNATVTGVISSGGVSVVSYGVAYADAIDGTMTISTARTTAGAATATAFSPSMIAVSMPYTLDTGGNNTYTVEYRLAGQNSYTAVVTAAAHVTSPFNTMITGLTPGTSYDIRLTYNDAEGVYGANPQLFTMSTMAAGVDQLDAWSNVYSAVPGTVSVSNVATSSFTVSEGSNRLLTAGVCINMAATATITSISVKLDSSSGAAFTPIAAPSATAQREQCWMGYLTDTSITTGAHTLNVSVTMSASTISGLHVKAGSYRNVDQATPVAAALVNNAAAVTVPFAATGALAYNANSAVAYIAANGNTAATLADNQPPTYGFVVMTAATNNTNAHTSFIAEVFKSTSGSITATDVITFAGASSRSAVAIAALNPALATTSVTTPTAVNGLHRNIIVNPSCQQDGNSNNVVLIEWQLAAGDWTSLLGSNTGHCGSYTIPGLTAGLGYDVRVTYSDADGLTGSCSGVGPCLKVITPSVSVTETSTGAGTPSILSSTPYTLDVTVPFTFDANNSGTVTVKSSPAGAATWTTAVDNGSLGNSSPYTTTISSLLPNTSYDVQVTYADTDGVIGTAVQTITQSTPVENRTVAGVATAAAASITSISYAMPYQYDANGNNSVTVQYKLSTEPTTWTDATATASKTGSTYTGTIAGLTSGKRYDVTLTYVDVDGVVGTAAQPVTSILLPDFKTEPGAITFSNLLDVAVTIDAAYFNDTNGDNSCEIKYGTTLGAYGLTALPIARTDGVKFSATITGLTSNTTYYIQATFTDPDGFEGANIVLASVKTAVPWVNNPYLHNSVNTNSTKWAAEGGWGKMGGKYGAFTCTTCHIPGTSNVKWVRSTIDATGTSRTVLYKNVTSAGHDDRANGSTSYNVCEVCHTQNKYHNYNTANNTGGNAHNNGSVCNGCHPHSIGFKVDMTNCIGCHNKTVASIKIPGLVRGNAVAEFGLAWGHKKGTRNSAVTNEDCRVCHLEGDLGHSSDGTISLRDPDGTGNAPITNIAGNASFTFKRFSTSYAAGSRTATGHLADTIDNVVTQKFCLACHDSNGATNLKARAGIAPTQYLPFGTGSQNPAATYPVGISAGVAGGVFDAKSQFATTNASFHPVMGPKTKDFPTPARLNAPYANFTRAGTSGTKTDGVVINCFDCHNLPAVLTLRTIVAHGNNVTLRANVRVAGTTIAANLCINCHAAPTTSTGYLTSGSHGAGSAFATGNSNMNAGTMSNCYYCHGTAAAGATVTGALVARPVRAVEVHGFNDRTQGTVDSKWVNGAASHRPYAFIRNSLSYWSPRAVTTAGESVQRAGGCTGTGGTCNTQMSGTSTYTVGGSY